MAEVFETVRSAIGEKFSTLIFAITTCLSGIGYAFWYGPIFCLVCLAYLPFLLAMIGIFGMKVKKTTLEKLNVTKQLGGIAEETLTAIKVVSSFGREDREGDKFAKWANRSARVAKKQAFFFGLTQGVIKFAIFFFYTYSLYWGSYFILHEKENRHTGLPYAQVDVITVVIALITGFVGLIGALPNIQSVVAAKTCGALIFDVIDREPEIQNEKDCDSGIGFQLNKSIDFNNVTFKYPTSPPEFKPVLENATFSIKAGETTAIVGPSGSGKSTIIQLVERFYDPRADGNVTFDGKNIKEIDLRDLRENIGYVSQEPTMILGTIKDNLLFGNKDASDKQCHEAIEKANANFVYDQESGLDTFVGTAGMTNMSGG